MDSRLITIASVYGYDAQSRQLIEEMAELTQAINKFWRKQLEYGKKGLVDVAIGNREEEKIIEKIADVEICLEQIRYFFLLEADIAVVKENKINRQLERINNQE